LKGRPGWRVRIGDFRISYTINDGMLLIKAIAVSIAAKCTTDKYLAGLQRKSPHLSKCLPFHLNWPILD